MRRKLAYILLALLLALIFLGLNIDFQSQRNSFYKEKFKENKIDMVTGKSLKELEEIGKDLQLYLKEGDRAKLDTHFNNREVKHMEDVFSLFQWMRKIVTYGLLLSIFTLLFLSRKDGMKETFRKLGRAFWWVDGFILILIGLISIDFHRAFFLFHELFFNNDLWLMDPKKDLMIQMLPENFFADMGLNIGLGTLGLLLLFSALGLLPNKEDV